MSKDSDVFDGLSVAEDEALVACEPKMLTTKVKPNQALVHLALLCGQTINGGSSIVAKVGLPDMNPVFFALARELLASPLLLIAACLAHGRPRCAAKDLPLLLFAAFALFSNQIAWTAGLKLSNAIVGSAWQPSQPVFVLGMAVLLRWEQCTVMKTAGVFCALLGGFVMTFGSSQAEDDRTSSSSSSSLVGNLLFFYNCLMTAVFILCMRVITRRMPPYTALAIVYSIASLGIFAVSLLVGSTEDLQHFFCPDCEDGFWVFPPDAVSALLYWVLGCSVAAYLLLTFGAKHAKDATHCLAYTAMQPVTAGVLEALMVGFGWNQLHPENALRLLNGAQTLGALIVVAGVACVATEGKALPGLAHAGRSREDLNCQRDSENRPAIEPARFMYARCDPPKNSLQVSLLDSADKQHGRPGVVNITCTRL